MSDETAAELCSFCERNKEWPKCMADVKLREWDPIAQEPSLDVVECSNHSPMEVHD